jgi:uncharacterized protein (DUF1684 family)
MVQIHLGPLTMLEELELLDWKRRVIELYRGVRHQSVTDPSAGWSLWRSGRDSLFRTHSQSPLPPDARKDFEGLAYFEYDPDMRVMAEIEEAAARRFDIPASDGSVMSFTRFGMAAFRLAGETHELELYWLDAYGGGVFVPFKDATNGTDSYGGGRYLLDTVKGADLGMEEDRLVFDFNFAYNPSCSYDGRWACPLAPPPNHLSAEVRAGEKV